ncbi:MAG: glycine--tRNA ligase subunit beta [Anaerolineales bacterium]
MAAKKKTAPSLSPKLTNDFQTIVVDLQKFWVDWGCVLWQPHNSQVGAGTMNPATFLRVLGPEPWNVAYLEPSVRPDDGRYGENPNRLQQHYQFQVVLKPDPGNPQEVYLRSLQAIGIDVHKHDIRFVEDNWASPALGAWGLGWEVWLDGLEITQFTYFQQAGGITLDPVSVEITYGLDRIAMALQGAQTVGDVRWSQQRNWGDLNLQGESEHSKYYFEVASVERLRQMYELYEQEAKAALEAGLMLPSYDYVLKSSHTFNVLDARGAIGVTERQGYFRRMRALSSQVAEAYVAERQRLEYPWLEDTAVGAGLKPARTPAKKSVRMAGPKEAADFILEIGTEELPPSDLTSAIKQLQEAAKALLDHQNLKHGDIEVSGTPRRLVVHVKKLAPKQADVDMVVKGPPAARAFGADGTPTPAAEGFARGQGVAVSALKIEEIDGGKYAVARVHKKGQSTVEVLAAKLPELIAGLRFEQSMRWNASGVAFARPIRGLLALHGENVVPFEYAGLQSRMQSRGLRLSKSESFKVEDAKDYLAKLKKQDILLDPADRKAAIDTQVNKLAKQADGSVPQDDELLNEVVNLVEAPAVMRGEFDKSFLELPREVLIAVMKKHQRYFPVEKGGKLLNAFIAVGNGEFDAKAVTAGNADVLRARFTDAAYFINKDREHPLADYVDKLKGLTFQKDLGSMWDKTQRVVELTKQLSSKLDLSDAEKQTAQRAAQLSKADLATKMVVEMTSLQGVMGKYYALDSGEKPEVAEAILEHYLPRFSDDVVAESKPGIVLGLADRLDSLVGLISVGLKPTGSSDPFALRRAAIGVLETLMVARVNFDLKQGVALASRNLPNPASEEMQIECLEFILDRLRSMYLRGSMVLPEQRFDIAEAVLTVQGTNPSKALEAANQLDNAVKRPDWSLILDAFARCVRITRDLKETYAVDESKFTEDAEKALFAGLKQAEAMNRQPGSVEDFVKVFNPMIPAINTFFEKVMVMAEDESLRRNRLALLQRVAALSDGVADFSKLEGF